MSGSVRQLVLAWATASAILPAAGVAHPRTADGQTEVRERTGGRNPFAGMQNVRTGESARGVPVVDTRRATTALLLQDSRTIVIGGLRRIEKAREIRQVPLLGDLPLVGLLSRSTRTLTTRSELVVLLSPHLFTGEPVSAALTAEHNRIREMSLLSRRTDRVGPDGPEGPRRKDHAGIVQDEEKERSDQDPGR